MMYERSAGDSEGVGVVIIHPKRRFLLLFVTLASSLPTLRLPKDTTKC